MNNLTFPEFAGAISTLLGQRFPKAKIELVEETKNNGLKKAGVRIQHSSSTVAPVIYLETYYEGYAAEAISIPEIVERISSEVDRSMSLIKGDPDLSVIKNWETAKELLEGSLVNADANDLADLPARKMADLALTYRVNTSSIFGAHSSTKVTNSLLAQWGVTEEDLYEETIKNQTDEVDFKTLGEKLYEMMGVPMPMEVPGLYVLMNKSGVNGASMIANTEVMNSICDDLGVEELVVIPSSIHEVLLMDESLMSEEVNALKDIVLEVNQTQVAPEEKLSDNVYKYNKNSQTISIAA